MVKILGFIFFLQDNTVDKVKDIIEEDVWGTIKEWLGFELISVGKEPNHIGFTVGHLIVVVVVVVLICVLSIVLVMSLLVVHRYSQHLIHLLLCVLSTCRPCIHALFM